MTAAAHAGVLARMLDAAEVLLDRGDHEHCAAVVQSAVGLVVLNHPGAFADARAERLLAACAATLDPVAWTGGRGVLHVLSNTDQVGGLTRLAWRWMTRDAGRPHAFCVTRPLGPPPAALVDAAARSGGGEHALPGVDDGLLATAQALRALAAGHDLVVLHVQPNDVLASLAFAGVADRAPTLFDDHADHCLWIGRDAADVVVGHRPSAARLTVERRGVPAARCATVPLPLEDVTSGDRDAARRRLGLPADVRVLLTIGTAYKYAMAGPGEHLLDAVLPLDDREVLLAAGPADDGRWAAARAATGGRVQALGVVGDLGDLLAAADVLVEAYPCSSGTAALEAALGGLPVVAYAPDPAAAGLLGSAGAAAGLWPSCPDPAALRTAIDAIDRARDGAVARAAVQAHHAEGRWRAAVADAERTARTLGPVRREELADPPVADASEDRLLLALHLGSGHAHPAEGLRRLATQAEAVARWPELAHLFAAGLVGPSTHLELRRGFGPMVAAPVPGDEGRVVAALRTLLHSGIVPAATVLLDPGAVEDGLVALQQALDAGGDVDLDVVAAPDPGAHLGPGTTALRTPADRFGALPDGVIAVAA